MDSPKPVSRFGKLERPPRPPKLYAPLWPWRAGKVSRAALRRSAFLKE